MKKETSSIGSGDYCTLTLQIDLDVIEKLKKKAEIQGISYKDLIRSVIHDYVDTDDSILDMIGVNKGSGLYKSVDEIDETITQLRKESD